MQYDPIVVKVNRPNIDNYKHKNQSHDQLDKLKNLPAYEPIIVIRELRVFVSKKCIQNPPNWEDDWEKLCQK